MKGNYDSMTCGCKDADNMRKAHPAKYTLGKITANAHNGRKSVWIKVNFLSTSIFLIKTIWLMKQSL